MTHCISPDEIQEGDLMAYVDGRADSAVRRHVRGCAYCAGRAADLDELQRALRAALPRAACPDPQMLGDLHLKLLPPEQELAVAKHLRDCCACAAEFRLYAAAEEPEGLSALWSIVTSTVSGVVAANTQSGQLDWALVGGAIERGAGPQRWEFRAARARIALDYQPGLDNRGTLAGVLLAGRGKRPWAGVPVNLYREGRLLASRTMNSLGGFVFEGIAPGHYDLSFERQGRITLIGDLEIA
jgi:anti-sigma factor RsiW